MPFYLDRGFAGFRSCDGKSTFLHLRHARWAGTGPHLASNGRVIHLRRRGRSQGQGRQHGGDQCRQALKLCGAAWGGGG